MIIMKLMGGLGNQMFQYSCGRALSLRKGVPLKLDLGFLLDRTPKKNFIFRDYDLPIFRCNPEIASQTDKDRILRKRFFLRNKHVNKIFPIKNRYYYTEKTTNYDNNIEKIGSEVFLEGYWQSYKYFSDFNDVIKKDFEFKHNLDSKEEVINQMIKSTNSVCVNVRRADFLASSFHGVCGEKYFKDGVNYLENFETDLKIFVFSDDMDWCKKNLKFNHKTFFVGHEYAGHKFQSYLNLMTNCKYFIIPNSSFGWWAAWLCNNPKKIIITPKKWYGNVQKTTPDLIPSNWVRI